MSVTIYGDRINYNGYGDQYIAAGSDFNSIGSYVTAIAAVNSNYVEGNTIAGSSLRYSYGSLNSTSLNYGYSRGAYPANSTYDAGGNSLSGTWRKMSGHNSFYSYAVPAQGYTPAYTGYTWTNTLWKRIS